MVKTYGTIPSAGPTLRVSSGPDGEDASTPSTPATKREMTNDERSLRRTGIALAVSSVVGIGMMLVLGDSTKTLEKMAHMDARTTAATASQACDKSADTAKLYKYTIASSYAREDAEWAETILDCECKNLSYTCEPSKYVGKTSCAYLDLHFIYNKNTEEGDTSIQEWDDYQVGLHREAFELDTFDQFMDYSMTFYTIDASDLVNNLRASDTPFLSRKYDSTDALGSAYSYYTFVVASPGGKVFEVTSPSLDSSLEAELDIKSWDSYENECAAAHYSSMWSTATLDHYSDQTSKSYWPIRTNIAVTSVDAADEWWSVNMPAVQKNLVEEDSGEDSACGCKWKTYALNSTTKTTKSTVQQIRFVENPNAYHTDYSVTDLRDYMAGVNDAYTTTNGGWSAWWDRHSGIYIDADVGCNLDSYMSSLDDTGTSFHPHGRGTYNLEGLSTDHVWTSGAEGWGLEIQGHFDFSYADCYSVFDWCTSDSDPTSSAGWTCSTEEAKLAHVEAAQLAVMEAEAQAEER